MRVLSLVLALMLAACKSTPTGPDLSLSGEWSGEFFGADRAKCVLTIWITDDRGALSGDWERPCSLTLPDGEIVDTISNGTMWGTLNEFTFQTSGSGAIERRDVRIINREIIMFTSNGVPGERLRMTTDQ